MLYEVWTATARPGVRAELFDRIAHVLPARERMSPLVGAWYSEIGTLNEVVHVWAHEDHAALTAASLGGGDEWPPAVGDLLVDERIEYWTGVEFVRPVLPGPHGPVYEMRTYTFRPGTMPKVLDVWAAAVPDRVQLSPLVALWCCDVGLRHRLRHIWAYRSLDERARIRDQAGSQPNWPPMTREWRVHEESQILLPAPYSPLH